MDAVKYGAEAWTLKIRDGRIIKHVSWMEKITDHIMLQEHGILLELLIRHVRKYKLSYFGQLSRDYGCQI